MTSAMLKVFAELIEGGLSHDDKVYAQTILNIFHEVVKAEKEKDGNALTINTSIITGGDVDKIRDELKGIKNKIPSYGRHTDNRARQLYVKNFRSFPEGKPPYGLLLTVEEKPYSVFLVGANGTGKSTLYDAMEYYYTGECTAYNKLREISPNYLHFGFNANLKHDVNVEAVDNIKLGELGSIASPCFISDSDLNSNDFPDNLSDFIMSQLGYSLAKDIGKQVSSLSENLQADLVNLMKFPLNDVSTMKEVINMALHNPDKKEEMLKESKRFSNVDEIKKVISSGEKDAHSFFSREWKQLTPNPAVQQDALIIDEAELSLHNGAKEHLLDDSTKSLANIYHVLHGYVNAKDYGSDRYKKELQGLLKLLKRYEYTGNSIAEDKERLRSQTNTLNSVANGFKSKMSETIRQFNDGYKAFIENTLNNISISEHDVFQLRLDADSNLFVRISNKERGITDAKPVEYLNTFRLKMFKVCMKLSLAFLQMKRLDKVLPIVVDDVFNSNDFSNGLRLDRFVYNVYRTYNEQVGFDEPLQIILLTHDELIQSAFKKGFTTVVDEDTFKSIVSGQDHKNRQGNYICGRLFPYSEMEKMKIGDEVKIRNLYIEM